ncbi:MAG: BT_3987 domain-containing protein [Candidatus Cryptobacteroides sp.]
MKTSIYKYLSVPVLAAVLLSCSDKAMDIFPEQYKTIVYIKESSANYVTIDATAANTSFDFTVCKGGSEISNEADARITPLTQDYVDEQYNSSESNIQYRVLPEDAWSVDSPMNMHFSSEDTYKVVSYTLISERLAALTSENPKVRYIIGFSLDSKTASVNEKYSRYICEISDVIVPTLGFERAGLNRLSTPIDESYQNDELQIKIPVEVKSLENRWDIEARVVLDPDWLSTFNAVNSTNYEMPVAYSFSKDVKLASNQQKAYVTVNLKGVSSILKAVVLPLKLIDASQFKVSEMDEVYALMIDPTIGHPVLFDRSKWVWKECCHEPWENSGNCSAFYMIDNQVDSYWHYSWEADSPCKGHDNHCFVFDMGESKTVSSFGYVCRQDMASIWGGDSINALSFFISDNDSVMEQDVHDHSNWTKIIDAFPVETINAEQTIPSRLAIGRYVKVMIAGSAQIENNNGVMKGCIAEIKVYGKNNN